MRKHPSMGVFSSIASPKWVQVAGVLAVVAFSQNANATTVAISNQDTTMLPTTNFVSAPASSLNFVESTTGSVFNPPTQAQLSPYGNNTTPYSVISSNFLPGDAIYNLPNVTAFSFLWGSPDAYNTLEFFSGANGTGTLIGTFIPGTSPGLIATDAGFDYISFLATGGTIGSVEMLDNGDPAFEFADVTATPIPAALPLFATGLGFLGWVVRRRKQKASGVIAAA